MYYNWNIKNQQDEFRVGRIELDPANPLLTATGRLSCVWVIPVRFVVSHSDLSGASRLQSGLSQDVSRGGSDSKMSSSQKGCGLRTMWFCRNWWQEKWDELLCN